MLSVAFVDEKWTWRIPIASAVCSALVMGYLRGFGIIIIAYSEQMDFPNFYLMIALGICAATVGILATFVKRICQLLTARYLLFVSGLWLFTAMFISSFLQHPAVFISFMGIATGLGFAIVYTVPLFINGMCFNEYQSSAIGIAQSGSSLGQIILPLCFNALVERFTVSGSLLLLSAIYSNICVLAMLFPSCVINRTENIVVLNHGEKSKCRKNFHSQEIEPKEDDHSSKAVNSWRGSSLFLVFISLANFAYTNQFLIFPYFMREHGISRTLISHIISVQGIIDFLGRIVTGFIANRIQGIQRSYLVSVSLILQGVIAILVSQRQGLILFVIYGIIYSITGAIYMSQWSMLIVDMATVKWYPTLFTRSLMVMGTVNLPLTFSMGYLRDFTRTYSVGLLITGLGALLSAALLLPSVVIGKRYFVDKDCEQELHLEAVETVKLDNENE